MNGVDVPTFPERARSDEFLAHGTREALRTGSVRTWRFRVRPFTLNYARPRALPTVVTPYRFDESLQLNVLPDGRLAVSDPDLLLAAGTTTSTAGSQTHFDD
ncbi:hypothetical protein GCM10017771_58930 [Streptomyces capitiformicae]|uniref:ATP-grasp target RiPP n=1 Tax=Streptomyces capitiformicae TaxID=2014920 RepID=A0A918Z734_9ACTN|nr:hypothetical protein GCM10017771_58930 [Streptomyces capitiformicae]